MGDDEDGRALLTEVDASVDKSDAFVLDVDELLSTVEFLTDAQ